MNQLQKVFEYNGCHVRTIVIESELWFVAKDICEILDLGSDNINKHVFRLSDNMKGRNSIPTPGGNQDMWCVNEAGLYKLVFTSRKPEAERFTDWVAGEVIPSIRRTGGYSLQDPQKLIALALVEAQRLLEQKDQQLTLMKPKADFFDAVASSKDAIDISSASKVLNMGVGRNKLFEILRAEGVLMKENTPYQKYIDAGYFRVIEQKYTKPDGTVCINIKTLVYQKGLNFIRKLVESLKTTAV